MYYIVVLQTERHFYRVRIEGGKKYTIGSGKKDLLAMPELGDGSIEIQLREKKGELVLKGKKIKLERYSLPRAHERQSISRNPLIAARWSRDTGPYPGYYQLSYDCQIHIGRSPQNDIVLNENFVSRNHLVITSERGEFRVEDAGSRNGTFLNGMPVRRAVIKSGDVLDILELRIRFLNNRLYFENLHHHPEMKSPAAGRAAQGKTEFLTEGNGYLFYHRSPRIREALPDQEITLSHVPNRTHRLQERRGGFMSIISSGAMAGASLAMGTFSPAMLAMRGAMMISPVGNMISGSSKKAKKQFRVEEEERFRKYSDYIAGEKAHIQSVGVKQSQIISRENPTPAECEKSLFGLRTTLWERRPSDSDFLQVRMGAGYAPLCVEVKPPTDVNEFRMERDELEEMTNRIIQETRLVDNVPERADLLRYSSVGIVGTRRKVIDLVKNMLISLTTLHYFKDVRIVGIFDPDEEAEWKAMRWLPHVWDADRQTRYLNFDELTSASLENTPIDESSIEVDPYREFREKLGSLIAARSDPDYQKKWANERTPIPHYVFIFGSKRKTECLLSALTANNPAMGISTIFLYDKQYYLPNFCQYIVNVDDPYDNQTATAFYKDTANDRMWFTMDPPVSRDHFDRFCRRMAAVEVDDTAGRGQIPSSLTFLQCLGVGNVEDLDVLSRWQNNSSAKKVTAPLGESEGGKLFSMSLHRHCSHGLVAGMTGSGKSEILISWILSMACNYHPHDVAFVVIDYKGGSTAYAVEKLPHVLGIITDSGAGIDRCFQSLEHELKRREEIFADCSVNDIKDYIKGFHDGSFKEALPRLVIVIDEFKELIKERPAVKKMVDSIAAKGSSLGVHLVLATQSPADAVDEGTWNNTQYQICMKVQNAAASKVMIHEPDAAMITQSGRAYVRVGTSEKAEIFELIQSAWSGAPYHEDQESGGIEVRVVMMDGERIKTVEENQTRFGSPMKELDAVVGYIAHTAVEAGLRKLPSPWKPDVPGSFTLEKLPFAGGFDGTKWTSPEAPWLSVPVGIFDRPELQLQGIQYMDFARDGNYGIFGSSQTGKTSLIRTLVTSLCRMYSPQDVNIYIIGEMAGMEAFPQVGGVVGSGQDEKFEKLIKMLQDFLKERRQVFGREHVDSLKAYRELVSPDMPAIFVLIDRFSGILESYQDTKDIFVRLFGEGPSKGIYFVYTGVNNTGVPYKLTTNVSGAISFMQTDKSEYSTLIGSPGDRRLPDRPGSALIREGRTLIGFQKAMYEPGENDKDREIRLKEEAEAMTKAWHGAPALRIPVLPDQVAPQEMADISAAAGKIAVGYEAESIAPAFFDPESTTSFTVMGKIGCGKTAMLGTITRIIRAARPDTLLFCIDTNNRGLAGLEVIGAKYAQVSDEETIDAFFSVLLSSLNERARAKKKDPNALADAPLMLLVIDDIKQFSALPDGMQMSLHRILYYGKGLGVLVLCGIRLGDMYNFYTQDQIGLDLKNAGLALALSDSAVHYEGCYTNSMTQKQRNEVLTPGFGLFYRDGGCVKIKCVDRE